MFGRVLIVGGNDEMVGAPVLAGTAAFMILSVRQWIKFACARAVVKTGPIQESVAADVRRLCSIGFLFKVSLLRRLLQFRFP